MFMEPQRFPEDHFGKWTPVLRSFYEFAGKHFISFPVPTQTALLLAIAALSRGLLLPTRTTLRGRGKNNQSGST